MTSLRSPRDAAVILLLAAAYFVAGKLGLKLAFVHPNATAVWPPTGIALAALLTFGYRVWPGIFLGAFLVNLTTAGSMATSIGIAVGNTLEGLVAAHLVSRFASGRNAFGRAQDTLNFAVLAGMLSTTISATFGVTSLSLGGFANWARYGPIWLTWWMGDAVAALVLVPLLLLWSANARVRWNPAQVFEALVLLICLLLVGLSVFGGLLPFQTKNYPLEYLCIPFLIWPAFRFGQREAALALFVFSGMAVWGTVHGFGPFVRETHNESLLLLQVFVGVIAAATMAVAAIVSERSKTEEASRKAHDDLELRVQQRTKELSNATAALRDNEERFRLLVEHVKDYANFLLDPSGRVISWNLGAEQLKGYRAEEIIGEHFSIFYSAEDIAKAKPDEALRVAAAKGSLQDEGWLVRKDGSRFWAIVTITALRDSDGNLLGFGKVTRAIDERFAAVAETASDAILSADSLGNITYLNKAAERIFGYPAPDVLGKPLTVLMPERFHDAHRRGLARYLSTGEAHVIGKTVELAGKRKDGNEFPMELSLANWVAAGQTHFTGIARDITERKRTQEALEQQRTELALSNAELAAANKELEAFTYSVSHDLRAPLRHVDGFSRILLEELGPQLSSNAQHCLQRIQDGVRQMGHLVDDLLNLGRVGRQALVRQPTALKSLVLEALAELNPETEGREIEWQIGDLPIVECDPGLIKLVFTNLLSNAVKFTRPQKHAVIQVGHLTPEGHMVFFVRDNGIGFNMRYADKLFGIFQRLHRQEDFEGTGVGLANVQRIVHRHAGRVWAESKPYKGATFFFTLGSEATGPEANATVRGGAWQPMS